MGVALTIKNIPQRIHEGFKRRAKLNRRSLNAEILESLEHAIVSQSINVESILAKALSLRAQIKGRLRERQLNKLKNLGRK